MSQNRGSYDEESPSKPLLSEVTQDQTRIHTDHGWWNKILDLDEAKVQIMFSLPMLLTNLAYYLGALISVMFAGHLGVLQLAGATLANSFFSVTGIDVMMGLSGALETLCGQGFGAKDYEMLGIYLQSCCIISLVVSAILSIIWYFTESILIFLHQSPDIARTASLYLKYLIPALFAVGILQNILRFHQTQSVLWPLVFLSAIPLILHIGVAYALTYFTPLGFKGAPVSLSFTCWFAILLLVLYVLKSSKFKDTWKGFSFKSFHYLLTVSKLALSSAAMVCLEYWAFEILVFLAGLLPNSEVTTSLIAICISTEVIGYMFSYGLGAAASTRVANELGADRPERAKHAMAVTLKLSIFFSLFVVAALLLGQGIWIQLFSSSPVIKQEFASMAPLLAISLLLDCVQGVLSAVVRGCGWQNLAVFVNLGTFYLIGLPISCLLAFKFKLHAQGLWIGLICGMACQTGALLIFTKYTKWTKLSVQGTEI